MTREVCFSQSYKLGVLCPWLNPSSSLPSNLSTWPVVRHYDRGCGFEDRLNQGSLEAPPTSNPIIHHPNMGRTTDNSLSTAIITTYKGRVGCGLKSPSTCPRKHWTFPGQARYPGAVGFPISPPQPLAISQISFEHFEWQSDFVLEKYEPFEGCPVSFVTLTASGDFGVENTSRQYGVCETTPADLTKRLQGYWVSTIVHAIWILDLYGLAWELARISRPKMGSLKVPYRRRRITPTAGGNMEIRSCMLHNITFLRCLRPCRGHLRYDCA